MNNLKNLISDYLKEAKLMQVATVKGNKPWVASVWYVHDDNWNLYFISRRSRRHSRELKKNYNVAGAIVLPHTKGSGQKVRGLQFEGIAHELTDQIDILKIAHKLYLSKYTLAEEILIEDLSNPNWIATYYQIVPALFVLFDEVHFPDNPRQEFKL